MAYGPSKRKWKRWCASILMELDFIFEIWVYGRRTIKRDLIQRCWLETSAQENLDKYLWATKQFKRAKIEVSLPNPDTPGIGPDTTDPFAWSVRVLFPGWKTRVARSLRAYTQSLRVPFRPTAISGLKTINTPTIPLQPSLLPLWRAELKPKPRKSSLTPFSPFLSDSLEGFEWEASKSKD